MQLEQAFTLQAPLEPVWRAFHDIELLVDCLPGASIDRVTPTVQDGGVALLFKVKLGPIAAQFKGRSDVSHDELLHTGRFAGSAVDGKTSSRIRGEARFALKPDAGAETVATCVTVTVEFTITGALAQFSREGIVRALADTLTRQFADNLQQRLPQAGTPVAGEAAATAPPITAPSAGTQAPMASVGYAAPLPDSVVPGKTPADTSLDLWQLLKAWLHGLLRNRDSPK